MHTIEDCDRGLKANQLSTEVPGIFAPYIHAREQFDRLPHRRRQGLVPDFKADNGGRIDGRVRLGDVKVIHDCPTRYRARHMRGHALAVEQRANAVHAEYHRKARDVDRRYNGCRDDEVGPCGRKLDSFPRIEGFVVGSYGESSKDLLNLLREEAALGAQRCWRDMGARSADEAAGLLYTKLRRNLGIAIVRARARLLIDRVNLILAGNGAREAAQRRASNRFAWRQLRVERSTLGGFAQGQRHAAGRRGPTAT